MDEKMRWKYPNGEYVIFSKNEDNVQKMSTLLCTKLFGPLRSYVVVLLDLQSVGLFIC